MLSVLYLICFMPSSWLCNILNGQYMYCFSLRLDKEESFMIRRRTFILLCSNYRLVASVSRYWYIEKKNIYLYIYVYTHTHICICILYVLYIFCDILAMHPVQSIDWLQQCLFTTNIYQSPNALFHPFGELSIESVAKWNSSLYRFHKGFFCLV